MTGYAPRSPFLALSESKNNGFALNGSSGYNWSSSGPLPGGNSKSLRMIILESPPSSSSPKPYVEDNFLEISSSCLPPSLPYPDESHVDHTASPMVKGDKIVLNIKGAASPSGRRQHNYVQFCVCQEENRKSEQKAHPIKL